MKKRIISFLLSLCMVCSLLPGTALATDSAASTSEVQQTTVDSQSNGAQQSNDGSQSEVNQESNGIQQPNGDSQAGENQKPKDEDSSNGDETKESNGPDNGSGSVGVTQQSPNTEGEQSGAGSQNEVDSQPNGDSQRNVVLQADVQPNSQTVIYVAKSGSDDNNGTEESPFATLAKAVDVAADDATIYVMSNLTMTECARIDSKNLTITSLDGEGSPYTITRSEEFKTISDNSRSWYNPAMIEVQTANGSAGLTLTNIILDDNNEHEGSVFAQAISGEDNNHNTDYVQDAIIASNATMFCTITLGEGAILRNFGGMSALRATDQVKIVMENGSMIEDSSNITRNKGEAGSVGPAGVVWIQGGTLEMKEGSKIQNINGRAVYADGGTVTIGGTISGITGSKEMWQNGKEPTENKDRGINGTVLHLRNNAEGTLTATALIENISGGGHAVYCAGGGKSFEMESGSKITDCPNLNGNVIYAENCTITIDGEISNVNAKGNHILQTAGGTTVTIGENGAILNNHAYYGAVYINGTDEQLNIYGKINNNICTDRCGGVALSNNGSNHNATMYPGAEIRDNTCDQTGGGVMVSKGTFTMNGGTISGNISGTNATKDEDRVGGGVFVRRGGQFIMNDGTIENNATTAFGGGICFDASDYGGFVPKVELNGGTIENNQMNATITVNEDDTVTVSGGSSNDLAITIKDFGKVDRYLSISNEVIIGNKAVYFQTDSKTVTPADDSLDIKLGNTSTANVTKLANASNGKGWNQPPLATFWAQRGGAATLSVGGLTTLDSNLPVYVLALPVSDTGAASDVPAQVYAAQKITEADTSVNFTLPDISDNGYAIAIVQPTEDYGTLTIDGPASIQEDKNAESYSVAYTVRYEVPDGILSSFNFYGDKAGYSLAIHQDSHLKIVEGTPKLENGTITATYTCTLPADNFAAGESLFTSAELTITIGDSSYTIPSNVVKTQMVESTPSPTPTATPTAAPTATPTATPTAAPTATPTAAPKTTPTPVVTVTGAIPKTGDDSSVTLWMVLCVASALALGGVSFYSRKKR